MKETVIPLRANIKRRKIEMSTPPILDEDDVFGALDAQTVAEETLAEPVAEETLSQPPLFSWQAFHPPRADGELDINSQILDQ